MADSYPNSIFSGFMEDFEIADAAQSQRYQLPNPRLPTDDALLLIPQVYEPLSYLLHCRVSARTIMNRTVKFISTLASLILAIYLR